MLRLKGLAPAEAGVGHNRRAAGGLVSAKCVPSTHNATARCRSIKRVPCAELMTHLVCDVIDVETVADRRTQTRFTLCFVRGVAENGAIGSASSACPENVADIVISRADVSVGDRLVRSEI